MFSKSKDEPSYNKPAQRPSNGRVGGPLSIIAADVTITGDIKTEGELQLDGTVLGDIRCGAVTIGETGKLNGALIAGQATIRGSTEGEIHAKTVILERSARVKGDVTHESLSIEAGAQVHGMFLHRLDPHLAAGGTTGEGPSLMAVTGS
jgi:cytoskeletal protein CcmA (bactofilin family)